MTRISLKERIFGGIIGSAVGDALGVPMECMHCQDIEQTYGNVSTFEELGARTGDSSAVGQISDDTAVSDVLMDCILAHDGQITAYDFAEEWANLERPIPNPDGEDVIRLNLVHPLEHIPLLRNMFIEINKRELGRGEANATNAIMYIAPVGLLCAGDPLKAELMAVDITSVNQHGRPRDVAGGYCAALAACFLPDITVEEIVQIGIRHTRDYLHSKEITAIVSLARTCTDCKEFIRRYYSEILGHVIPFLDAQHQYYRDVGEGEVISVSWNSSEVLGVALATFLITKGEDAREMMLACARIGRDADTICRVGGGLIGAYQGIHAIPKEWRDFVLRRNRWLRLEEKAEQLSAIVMRNLQRDIQARRAIL